MKRTVLAKSFAILVGIVIVVTGCSVLTPQYTFRGSAFDPPVPAADFVLTDQHEQSFQLSGHQGKVVVMFFGYTRCPDVCPTSLADFKRVRTLLGDQADKVEFAFVTVDPERDTPARLGEYMAAFDPAFKGLSGDIEELEHVWESYGVYHEKQEVGSAAGYLIDHTARVYVVDTAGNLRLTFAYGTEIDAMVSDIRYLAKEAV